MMEEDKAKYYEEYLLRVIKENKVTFFDHCFGFTPFSRGTAYNHKLHELDTIKDAIDKNKLSTKNVLINKWVTSDNATLNLAAYRLLSNEEEHKKLNQSYTDHSNQGQPFQAITQVEVIHTRPNEQDTGK
jgi:hypothetical protein